MAEVVRRLSQGTLNTILSGIAAFGGFAAAIVGGVAIWIAVRHNRQRRREREEDRRLAEEQLELAHQEALRHPSLEVVGDTLVAAEEVEAVVRTREAKEKWRAAVEKAKKEEGESPKRPFAFSSMEVWGRVAKEMGSYTIEQAEYEGPYPDFVLVFELRNLGRRPAQEVTGRVTFDSDFLEPIEFPKLDGSVSQGFDLALARGSISGKRALLEVGTVPPYPSEKTFIFRIAVLKKGLGKTAAAAVFSTPEGDYLEKGIPLEVP